MTLRSADSVATDMLAHTCAPACEYAAKAELVTLDRLRLAARLREIANTSDARFNAWVDTLEKEIRSACER